MSRIRLLGIAGAVAALVLATFAFNSSGVALAADPGPAIGIAAPATALVGSPFTVTLSAQTSATAFNAFNVGVVYDGSNLTGNPCSPLPGCNDLAGGLAGWGGDLCPANANYTDPTLPVSPPLTELTFACTSLGGQTSAIGAFAQFSFTGSVAGVTALHMVTFGDVGNVSLCQSVCTFTADAANGQQTNNYVCASVPNAPFPAGACGPLPVPGSTAADAVIVLQQPAPVLTASKAIAPGSVVAGGQAFTITLGVSNAASPATTATGVTIKDTLSALIPIANVTLPAGCTNVLQVVTCSVASLAPGASASFVLNVSATDPSAGGNTISNQACANDTNVPASTQSCANASLNVIPPAVAWSKSPTDSNDFISTAGDSFSFDEIMTNQGDPNGLGGFSFDIHYDPTIFGQPTIDLSPAIALFAASGRTLDCSITILGNGIDHVACASTGPIGTGPQWVGPKVMAHVTLTPLEIVTEQVRPNKENGIVTAVKDTQTTVTNTCGQPLNDGSIQPLPGQPECQGLPLQGVGPGGILNDSMTQVTIRRLEGDVTQDCSVGVADMQNEASRFGMSVGNLLYNVFYDVNSPLQHGDGEIDINDIQFVYGRSGSTCASPIPPQPPAALP